MTDSDGARSRAAASDIDGTQAKPSASYQRAYADEPTTTDRLEREAVAEALVEVIGECRTPLVIGLYGTWGTGKTSVMQLTRERMLSQNPQLVPIWFDAWQHQFDDEPVLALLHTLVESEALKDDLGRRARRHLHRQLTVIAGAFGGAVLKKATSLNVSELRELGDQYDRRQFAVRERRIKLRDHFAKLIRQATERAGAPDRRLVFFIDDLDRCQPDQVLRVLEALKLFLNMEGCVYVLGVDRAALEQSIAAHYGEVKSSEADYLDKIVQLPFTLPPISTTALREFVRTLLPAELKDIAADIVDNLGDNPRRIKRFINTYLLSHQLARRLLKDRYDHDRLATVLLLQHHSIQLFREAATDPKGAAERLAPADEDSPGWRVRLAREVGAMTADEIAPYIHLSELSTVPDLTFHVELEDPGTRRMEVFDVLKRVTGQADEEIDDRLDAAPTRVFSAATRDEAERVAAAVNDEGGRASVEIDADVHRG